MEEELSKSKGTINGTSNDDVYESDKPKRRIIPNAAFPFCEYGRKTNEGVYVEEYNEYYCNAFQVKL